MLKCKGKVYIKLCNCIKHKIAYSHSHMHNFMLPCIKSLFDLNSWLCHLNLIEFQEKTFETLYHVMLTQPYSRCTHCYFPVKQKADIQNNMTLGETAQVLLYYFNLSDHALGWACAILLV